MSCRTPAAATNWNPFAPGGNHATWNALHQFAHELLRKQGTWIGLPAEPEVLSRDEDRADLLARWLHNEGRSEPDDLRRAMVTIDLARARGEPSAPYLDEWRAALDAEGALDFGAMIDRAIDVLALPSTRRSLGQLYGHIIVDEAQNLTPAQYRLLTGVAGGPPLDRTHVMLVGDDKQSIVGFSGAEATLMGTFADQRSGRPRGRRPSAPAGPPRDKEGAARARRAQRSGDCDRSHSDAPVFPMIDLEIDLG